MDVVCRREEYDVGRIEPQVAFRTCPAIAACQSSGEIAIDQVVIDRVPRED